MWTGGTGDILWTPCGKSQFWASKCHGSCSHVPFQDVRPMELLQMIMVLMWNSGHLSQGTSHNDHLTCSFVLNCHLAGKAGGQRRVPGLWEGHWRHTPAAVPSPPSFQYSPCPWGWWQSVKRLPGRRLLTVLNATPFCLLHLLSSWILTSEFRHYCYYFL